MSDESFGTEDDSTAPAEHTARRGDPAPSSDEQSTATLVVVNESVVRGRADLNDGRKRKWADGCPGYTAVRTV